MLSPKDKRERGMVQDSRPEALTTSLKSTTNSNDSAASREPYLRSLRTTLDQGLEDAASNSAMPDDNDTLREALDKGLTNATTQNADDQRKLDERKQKIKVKNRRMTYLESDTDYLKNPDLELAGECIRRFQSAKEREEDGKRKGFGGVMEADLWRSEAKLATLAEKELGRDLSDGKGTDFVGRWEERRREKEEDAVKYFGDKDEDIMAEDEDLPKTKEEGEERWRESMISRFIQGKDEDFDYGPVDQDDRLDIEERREDEEKWFEDEEPEWVNGAKENGRSEMETGVQDF